MVGGIGGGIAGFAAGGIGAIPGAIAGASAGWAVGEAVSTVADGINTGWYLGESGYYASQGDDAKAQEALQNAAWAGMGLIPVVGNVLGKGGKSLAQTGVGRWGGKALDWAGEGVKRGADWLSNTHAARRGGDALDWAGEGVKRGADWLSNTHAAQGGKQLLDWGGQQANRGAEWLSNTHAGQAGKQLLDWGSQKADQTAKWWGQQQELAEQAARQWNLPGAKPPTPRPDAPTSTPRPKNPDVGSNNPAKLELEAPAAKNADGMTNIKQEVGEAGLKGADNAAGTGRVVDKPVSTSQAVKIGDETHTLSVRQVGGNPAIYLCSDCGPLLSKIDEGLNDPNLSDAIKLQLKGLYQRVKKVDVSLKKGKFSEETIEQELQFFRQELEEIGESKLPIANKFPEESLDPDGKIFGEVKVVDGKITLDGRNVPREIDFVITTDNRLIIGRKHTTLSSKADVLAAGQIKINGQGKILRIDNRSGHFRPTVQESSRVPTLLREMGLDISGSNIQLYRFTIDSDGMVTDATKMIDEYFK